MINIEKKLEKCLYTIKFKIPTYFYNSVIKLDTNVPQAFYDNSLFIGKITKREYIQINIDKAIKTFESIEEYEKCKILYDIKIKYEL